MSQNIKQEGGRRTINVEGLFPDMFRPQKLTSFRDVVKEVMKLNTFQKFFVPVMEPLIRRVVKEELQLAVQNQTDMQWNSDEEIQPAEPRRLQLRFSKPVSQPQYSESLIEAKEGTKMEVALIDAATGEVVRNEPISSAKVEVVVLDGDFDDDAGDNWTQEKFNSNILRAREGKKAILTGNVVFNLKEGVGLLGNIIITDNSSWIRSRKFRLGARVLDNSSEIRVREAKTGPFVVKDHRSKSNNKHHPPSLSDEVWRLKRIGKEGAYQVRMNEKGITTVKDFLILLYQDPAQLSNILGKMTKSTWEAIVNHAKTCALDKSVNTYRGVVFNAVGQVMGLLRDGRYFLVDELSEAEKADARNLVTLAFKHWEDVLTLDDETSLQVQTSPLGDVDYPSNSAIAGSSSGVNILTSDNHVINFDYPELYASNTCVISPIISNVDHPSSSALAGSSDATDILTSDNDGNFDDLELYASITDTINDNYMDEFGSRDMELDEDNQFFNGPCSFQNPSVGMHASLPSAVDESVQDCSMENVDINKANLRWRKIFCVVRWLSVRRMVARKAMLQKQAFQSGLQSLRKQYVPARYADALQSIPQ